MAGIVALQLYTIREETEKDIVGALQKVAEMGYTGVEFAGYSNALSATEMAELLQATKLKAVGLHCSYEQLNTQLDEVVDYCWSIACPYIIVPWIDKAWLQEGAHLQQFAERLNDLGYRVKRRGLLLGYHNHNFEFETTIHSKPLFDQLVTKTDPALVKFELDTYWAAYASIEVIPLIQQLVMRQRLIALHLKDMTPARTFTEIGAGTLPISEYIKATQGSEWPLAYIVENDQPAIAPLESARLSLENLRKNAFLYPVG